LAFDIIIFDIVIIEERYFQIWILVYFRLIACADDAACPSTSWNILWDLNNIPTNSLLSIDRGDKDPPDVSQKTNTKPIRYFGRHKYMVDVGKA
jgi:hypothetical protein